MRLVAVAVTLTLAGPTLAQEPSTDDLRVLPPVFKIPARPKAPEREATSRRFDHGSSVIYEFEVRGATPDENGDPYVSSSFTIRRPDGTVAARSEPATIVPSADHRLVRRTLIELRGLAEGQYVLRLSVCDEVAGAIVETDEPIEVAPVSGRASDPRPASRAVAATSAAHTLEGYLVLVEEYRKDHRDPAVRSLAEWSAPELALTTKSLVAAGPSICDSACRQAAALLETDLAFSVLRNWDDGEANRHLSAARTLLDSSAPSETVLRDWLLAVGQNQRALGDLTGALEWFEECVKRLPNQAMCELAVATTREDMVFRFLRNASLRTSAFESGVDRLQADGAQPSYERLLRMAPDWIEAHLRYARYQLRRGDIDDARREATWVLDHSQDPPLRSRVRILLGVCDERQKRADSAVEHYRAAVDDEPSSQAARVALSHALFRAGRRTAAAVEARGFLEWPGGSQLTDGWLSAWTDAALERDRLMQSMRREVKR